MSRRILQESAIRVIRFTPRIAAQCASGLPHVADRIICDTIANGIRRPTGRYGTRGGSIVLFEKAFPAGRRGTGTAIVGVLGEVTRRGCFALGLRPGIGPKKIWTELGFLNRADSK